MFNAGQEIGLYTLIKRIGRGGFGEVWLAERRSKFVTTKVAIKLPLEEQVDTELIKREAALWEQASGHPNVLPIIDADEYDGQVVIVSEYATDGSLEQFLKENGGRLPIKKAVTIAIGILNGLEFLHSRKIIHRDVKTANVLLQGDTPRLADFGISRVMQTTAVSSSTAGTPIYMSPEAFDGKRNKQTDIWSVGIILFEMLSGSFPFSVSSSSELLAAIIMKEPAPLSEEIPAALRKVVMKALSKPTSERYQTALEMRNDLQNFLLQFSQEDWQVTQPYIQSDQFFSQATKKMPVSALQTAEPDKNLTYQIQGAQSLPSSNQSQLKLKGSYAKISLFAAILLLLTIGGGYYLLNRSAKTDPATNQNSSANLEDAQLIPFLKGGKYVFSDINKKIIVDTKYDDAYLPEEGLIRVKNNGKWGFLDKTGNTAIPIKYEEAGNFSEEGLAVVKLNGKYGFIDKIGNSVIPFKYDDASGFAEGLAFVKLSGEQSFIDKTDKVVIPLKYDENNNFSEGLARVKLNGKQGFIDKAGKVIIPLEYENASGFKESLANVVLNGKSGFIDKTGNIVIPLKYERVTAFKGGLAGAQLNGKWGFIDKMNNIIIPFKYEDFSQHDNPPLFSEEGLANVKFNGKWGFIDKTGNFIIPPKYETTGGFDRGWTQARLNNDWFYIRPDGTEYYEP